VSQDHCDTSITPDVPSSSSSSIISAEASNAVDSSVEALAGVPFSLETPVTASASSTLSLELCDSSPANVTSLPTTGVGEVVPVLSPKLLSCSESSPDLRQCSEEISANSEMLFDDQKRTDNSVRNRRNTSSSSLTDMSDNRGFKTKKRKRRHEDDEVPESRGLTFDKVPNYYTALSIPTRVMAGSAPRSSSDLIADFLRNERDPSPERKTCSTYDKLPAYYSSFTNSTRYDDHDYASLLEFEANFCQDEAENEERYGRSCDDIYEQHDLRSAGELAMEESSSDNDSDAEKGTDTENVSHFVLKSMYNVTNVVVLVVS